ncbi:MAG: aminoglycoside phosphotransferase family protein [Clostridia bacterium]|nr:aminoglycoside phosphotransferase family protein [Clostridia bacterium]
MEIKNLEAIVTRKNKKIYKDGNKLIKIFDEGYNKSSVFNEVLNQARVEETGLNIPKILEVTVIDGRWAIIMDYIEGTTIEQLIRENPDKEGEYLDFFIDIQRKIHEKRSPLLTKFKDKMTDKIMQCDLNASTRYDLAVRMSAMPMHNHLCHGDFNPSNVVITPSGEPYIIDWSHASQGNATADAAKTALVLRMEGREEFAEKYISRYCELTGTNRQYVDDWTPIVAAAQLVKVSPEIKKMLMKWIV